MNCHQFIERMKQREQEPALITAEGEIGYTELVARIDRWKAVIQNAGIEPGAVVSIESDYSFDAIAALLALWDQQCIVVPLAPDSAPQHAQFREIAQIENRVICANDSVDISPTGTQSEHPYYEELRRSGHPGLVLFTSGTSGVNKAAVHDASKLLEKFAVQRQQFRTIVFLQMDHIGGINTLLYTLSNGGTAIPTRERSPREVCGLIERLKVELLPTSPTFLNLMLLSGEISRRNLSSLQVITYGTESMPETTLQRLADQLPDVRLQQTYGMTELGILRSKSRDSRSLWVRIGGDEFETKVVDDRLWVRAQSAMLGYLNAPSPYDSEGFLDTGDRVETDGEWLRILGRDDETINVGGSKVLPTEVENVLLQLNGVTDVVVRSEPHPITGQIVSAVVKLSESEPLTEFKVRARQHCQNLLPVHAIPSRFRIVDKPLHSSRFKRIR